MRVNDDHVLLVLIGLRGMVTVLLERRLLSLEALSQPISLTHVDDCSLLLPLTEACQDCLVTRVHLSFVPLSFCSYLLLLLLKHCVPSELLEALSSVHNIIVFLKLVIKFLLPVFRLFFAFLFLLVI